MIQQEGDYARLYRPALVCSALIHPVDHLWFLRFAWVLVPGIVTGVALRPCSAVLSGSYRQRGAKDLMADAWSITDL
jgi:hypothetical protein